MHGQKGGGEGGSGSAIIIFSKVRTENLKKKSNWLFGYGIFLIVTLFLPPLVVTLSPPLSSSYVIRFKISIG